MFCNLMNDTVNEIKNAVNPIFRRPYLSVKLQNCVNAVGLYDTGADISCVNASVFEKIPQTLRPTAVPVSEKEQFRAAGGQQLRVKGQFNINVIVEGRNLTHNFFVIDNLNEPVIFGIDFIEKNELNYCASSKSFQWKGENDWSHGHLKVHKDQKLFPLSVNMCKVKVRTEGGANPRQNDDIMVNVQHHNNPCISGGPYLVKPDEEGFVTVPIYNCGPTEFEMNKNDFIGITENVSECEKKEINPRYLSSIGSKVQKEVLSKEKKAFILENVHLDVPVEHRDKYLAVILKNHECVSRHRFDLGRTQTLLHEISLKTEEPVYVKQFRIPDAHRQEVEQHVTEWLKMGVVQPARSKFNSPIFAVAKKNGGIRLVQDFRALNAQTHIDKYSMKDVSECIGEIGRSGSSIFSTIDLTGGFWQMLLQPKSRPYTAFTVPGKGQFQWVTSPMGLLGCPSSFQRLMETVVHGLQNVIVYIDDLLLHSSTHDEHVLLLDLLLQRLVQHNVKLNLQKCEFGSKNVAYLGFRLTEEGVKPGADKLKAVEKAIPPENVHEVRQFLGLCNFFRTHVRNFAQITAPLTALTRKDCSWKGGEMPKLALKAFRELQSYLCSEPVVAYPRRDRTYALITDASLGVAEKPGGLGAILTQIDKKGDHHVVAYASRKLQKHEANYTPFLLEMQAALWGMDHYDTYLRGRPFILFTDHRPLEKLGKVHSKTLNRLQEAMGRYNFEIVYKKGSEMPADYLSRNVVAAVNWEQNELVIAQQQDNLIRSLREFLINKTLPSDPKCQQLIRHFANDCFVENDLVWMRVKRKFEPSRVVIFLPENLIEPVLQEAHGHLMSGHDGIFKTKERLFQCYYWPGMDKDISNHIEHCHKCQLRRKAAPPGPVLVTPLPQTTEPNQRVHADLFGPLKASGSQKKYVLCVTDAFTKYVELVAIPNKEAPTVAQAIFERWFCRFGMPLELVTDQGKEFCSELSEDLFRHMQVSHLKTTAYHPQCNSQAEVANKTIAKYLASFVDETTLDWEVYLPPLMIVYNTSFHRSIKTTPFFLTFGMEPRLPNLPGPDVRRKFYGESSSDELLLRLLTARDVARRNNETTTDQSQIDVNRKAVPHKFVNNQLVLLDEHSFLGKNAKLCPKWSGPHRIIRLKHENNVELKMRNGRSLITHVNRLKPYHVPLDGSHEFKDPTAIAQPSPTDTQKPQIRANIHEDQHDLPIIEPQPRPIPLPPIPVVTPPIVADDIPINVDPSFSAPKRGRGRPRKVQTPVTPVQPPPVPTTVPPPPPPTTEGITLRSGRTLPAAQGGGNVTSSDQSSQQNADVQVSMIEDQGDWVMVVKKRKNKHLQKWTKAQNKNFSLFGDTYKTILCDHEDPVQVAIPPNPVVIFPPALPLPAPAPAPPPVPPPAPPPPPDSDTEEEDAADISLPTDTDFDFTTASEDEADATVVERETAKTPTNKPEPRDFQFGNFDADAEEIYAEIDPFASSSRLQRSPIRDQGARPKGILRQPIPNLPPGPPPRPVRLPPEVESAAFNPFASSSRVQRSPPRLTTQEADQLPKEFQPTAAERLTRSSGQKLSPSILSKYLDKKKKK